MEKLQEIWKPVVGYEGLYEVSSFGRVKSLPIVLKRNSGSFKRGEKILSNQVGTHGRLEISITKNGVPKRVSVHRLVAIAFIPNPDNKETVNHIDGNPKNNHVDNLEWMSVSDNIRHGFKNGLIPYMKKNRKDISKPIIQLTQDGEFVNEFPSIMEANRQLGFAHSNISIVLTGKNKLAYGYQWKFKD